LSIILATWEAEIRRIEIQRHLRPKVHETSSQPIAGHMPFILNYAGK
jgi:hypothetical protein